MGQPRPVAPAVNWVASEGDIVGRRRARGIAMANGQQVGRGECYDLADQALTFAGAKSAPSYGKITDEADYQWGRPIELKDVEAGDILQLRGHKTTIRTDTTIKKVFADGSSNESEKWNEDKFQRGHHTAIMAVNKGNGVLEVYEQHVKPLGKQVQRHTL
jgi:hypothetical protein